MRRWGLRTATLAALSGFIVFAVAHNVSKSTSFEQNFIRPKTAITNQKTAKSKPQTNIQDKKIETKQVTEAQPIPFQSITQNDDSLPKGSSNIVIRGVNGVKVVIFNITYVDGIETARDKLSEAVTSKPINQITKIGTHVAVVHSSTSGPAGATALCVDGFLSYAQNHQGACSKHGGVSLWYQ